MKVFLRKTIEKILMRFASAMLKKHKPDVIGITGSVGKSSTKEAIYVVLSSSKKVRRNVKNYNNEIGLPLTILGFSSAGFSVFAWTVKIIRGLLTVLFQKDYPEILVLEMGADRPGDIGVLTALAKPKIGIVTSVGSSHMEFFSSVGAIAREKGKLIADLPRDGYAILNNDDPRVRIMQDRTRAKVITYGFSGGADVHADIDTQNYILDADRWIEEKGSTKTAMNFKVYYRGNVFLVRLPRVIGEQYIYAALVAIACGIIFKVDFGEMTRSLVNFQPPFGRMNLVAGIKETVIVDDTYNSSPESAEFALDTFSKVKTSGRKIAVLGDMFELGIYSECGHRDVGKKAAEVADILITVGSLSEITEAAFVNKKRSTENIYHFNSSTEAGKFLQNFITKRDVILVKGSQSMRMEKTVKEVMAEPLRAYEFLVRQEPRWLKR